MRADAEAKIFGCIVLLRLKTTHFYSTNVNIHKPNICLTFGLGQDIMRCQTYISRKYQGVAHLFFRCCTQKCG